MRRLLFTAALFTALAPAALAQAPQTPAASASAAAATFARDRQAILAQTGEFRVRFDMREMVSFLPGYDPLVPKLSGGHEIVRLISDDGRHIRLQHILVMEHGGQTVVVKHWRQDWTYEPDTVLTYAGPDTWRLTDPGQRRRPARSLVADRLADRRLAPLRRRRPLEPRPRPQRLDQ